MEWRRRSSRLHPPGFAGLTGARRRAYADRTVTEWNAAMGRVLVFLVLAAIATALPAQQMFKCKQADGTISYQQLPCAESAQRQELNIYAPPPPTPVQTRRMVQAFDPATGVPTFAWIDGPAEPSGDFYITREFRTVVDPMTGIPRQALVDVRHPVSRRPSTPRQDPTAPEEPMDERYNPGIYLNDRTENRDKSNYYRPSDTERRNNSTYEKNRCRLLKGNGC